MSNGQASAAPMQFEARGRVLQAILSGARRCASEGTSLAVIAIEFDRFDALAVSAGRERAESVFAELLRAVEIHCGRDDDRVFRVAGDRIVAVCPRTLPAGARHVAAQIRDAADHLFPHAGHPPVTLSIGISIIAPGSEEGAEQLLTRAERSLEAARVGGGNKIVGAVPAPPPPPRTSLRALVKTVIPKMPGGSTRRQGD